MTQDENGVFVFSASMSGKLPMVAAESDTAAFTAALMEQPLPVGKAVLAYREMMTTEAFVALWGKILNVKTKYDFKPPSQMRHFVTASMPDSGMAEDMGESMECFAEMGYSCVDVEDDLLHPDEVSGALFLATVCFVLTQYAVEGTTKIAFCRRVDPGARLEQGR